MARLGSDGVMVVLCFVIFATILITPGMARKELDDVYTPATAPFPSKCRISPGTAGTLAGHLIARSLPSKDIVDDVDACQEVVETTKFCWDATIYNFERPKDKGIFLQWAENAWNRCVLISS